MTTYSHTLTIEDAIHLGGTTLFEQDTEPTEHTPRYYRTTAVASLVFSAFAILVIPGLIALALGHFVLANTVKDLPRDEVTRGYAIGGLIVTYATLAVGLLLVVLPHVLL